MNTTEQQLKSNNMQKVLEILLLFIGIPTSFLLPVNPMYKVIIMAVGVIYVCYVAFKLEKIRLRKPIFNRKYFFGIVAKFILIAFLSGGYIYLFREEDLFNVVRNNYTIWLSFMGVYVLFSVIPQEFVYRTFFFKRYASLINNNALFILLNAMIFSFAHVWFLSWLVLGFTFIGGVLFAYTYKRTNSFLLICIEHTLYGNWLYTVGFGEDFMFPIG